jgi:hypothetical protein
MLSTHSDGSDQTDSIRRFSRPLVLWATNGQWAGRIRQIDPVLGHALQPVDGPSDCWTAVVQELPAVVLVEFCTAAIHSQLELVWRMRSLAPALLILGLADRRWQPLEIALRELGPLRVAFRTIDLLPLAAMIYRWERQAARPWPERSPGGAHHAALLP